MQSTYYEPFVVEFDEMQHPESEDISDVPDLVDISDLPDLIAVSNNDYRHQDLSHSRQYTHFGDHELEPDVTSSSLSENLRQLLHTQRSKGRWERFRR